MTDGLEKAIYRKADDMDDAILAEQLAKTGNIMDLCNDPDWLKEEDGSEYGHEGQIDVGLASRRYTEAVNSLTTEQLKQIKKKARLQSILFTELSDWMKTWELGIGFEDVYTVSRRIVREHLQTLTPEQESWIENLMAEDKELERGAEKPVRQKTKAQLSKMFTSDDWQRMADRAAQTIKESVLQVGEVEMAAPETVSAA